MGTYTYSVYVRTYTLYNKSSASFGDWKKGGKPCQQHSKTPHKACFALEITARPCSVALRSKSPLERHPVLPDHSHLNIGTTYVRYVCAHIQNRPSRLAYVTYVRHVVISCVTPVTFMMCEITCPPRTTITSDSLQSHPRLEVLEVHEDAVVELDRDVRGRGGDLSLRQVCHDNWRHQ